jgi:hypothetical protein
MCTVKNSQRLIAYIFQTTKDSFKKFQRPQICGIVGFT